MLDPDVHDLLDAELGDSGSAASLGPLLARLRSRVAHAEPLAAAAEPARTAKAEREMALITDRFASLRARGAAAAAGMAALSDSSPSSPDLAAAVDRLQAARRGRRYVRVLGEVARACARLEATTADLAPFFELQRLATALEGSACANLARFAGERLAHWRAVLCGKHLARFDELLLEVQGAGEVPAEAWGRFDAGVAGLLEFERRGGSARGPAEAVAAHVCRRVQYHFGGGSATNADDRPEYVFGTLLKWADAAVDLYERRIAPAVDAAGFVGGSSAAAVIVGAVSAAGRDVALRAAATAPLSRLVRAALRFDADCAEAHGAVQPEERAAAAFVAPGGLQDAWVAEEAAALAEKCAAAQRGEDAWLVDPALGDGARGEPVAAAEHGLTAAGALLAVVRLLPAEEAAPSALVRRVVAEGVAPALYELEAALRDHAEATLDREGSAGLGPACQLVNSLLVLSSVAREWAVDPVYGEAHPDEGDDPLEGVAEAADGSSGGVLHDIRTSLVEATAGRLTAYASGLAAFVAGNTAAVELTPAYAVAMEALRQQLGAMAGQLDRAHFATLLGAAAAELDAKMVQILCRRPVTAAVAAQLRYDLELGLFSVLAVHSPQAAALFPGMLNAARVLTLDEEEWARLYSLAKEGDAHRMDLEDQVRAAGLHRVGADDLLALLVLRQDHLGATQPSEL